MHRDPVNTSVVPVKGDGNGRHYFDFDGDAASSQNG